MRLWQNWKLRPSPPASVEIRSCGPRPSRKRDTDASFSIDTATLAGSGGTIVDVTDGGDESALSFVFSPAGKLVAYYQHNQSPDVAFFCRTSGAEKALADAEACARSLVALVDGEGDGAAACEPE